ncbi:MAG: glycosyltransferase family 39 protein [Candidatus Obscuribacterales bacterium]|nr:glycosyltransferase family 39 protein [Candidatus Obscuribacterales bacterium]
MQVAAVKRIEKTTVKGPSKVGMLSWVAVIAAYLALNLLVISPNGNFSLNDDWVYGYGVRSLIEHGKIEMPTSFSTAFVHVGIGALACKLFGFSYTVLHWSTTILGIVAVAALYLALREVQVKRSIAGFTTFLFASNPLIVNLCFSFMSDIPSFAFTNLYLLFLFRGIRRDSSLNYLLSSVMLVAAAGVRQGALLYVVANLVIIGLSLRKGNIGKTVLLFLLLIVLPVAWTVGLESVLEHGATKCAEYTTFKQAHLKFVSDLLHSPAKWIFSMTVALGQISCYFAIFCLPLLLLFVPKLFAFAQQRMTLFVAWTSISAAAMATTLTKLVAADGRLMPFSMNVLRVPEVGAHNLMGINLPTLSKSPRIWLTHLSGVFAFLFLTIITSGLERAIVLIRKAGHNSFARKRAILVSFVVVAALLSLGCVSMETIIMDADRHYLIAFAPCLIALAMISRFWKVGRPGIVSCLLLAVIALYSTLATQDYMSWNRARWQGITELEAQGINPKQIDGGPEYVFSYNPDLALQTWRNDLRKSMRDYWRWWRVDGDQYIVSFSPVPGYLEINRKEYFSGLTFSNRSILILKRVVPDKPFIDPEKHKLVTPPPETEESLRGNDGRS